MELKSLKQMVDNSSGFLGINRTTNEVEVQNAHFFGRLVVWIRYKTSSSYRRGITEAQNQIQEAMMSDSVYGQYFVNRISQTPPEYLALNKPISVRAIRTFIAEVEHHAEQVKRAEIANVQRERKLSDLRERIGKLSACSGKDEDSRALEAKVDTMLKAKIVAEPGIDAADINREGIGEQLYKEVVADDAELLAITDERQMEPLVDKVLSDILDRRVGEAKGNLQSVLQKRLSEAALPPETRQTVEDAIHTSQIVDEAGLNAHINKIILQLHEKDFDGMLDSACTKYGFKKEIFNSHDIKQSLPAYLLGRADQRLSFASVPEHAMDFFREQGERKRAEAEVWIAKWIGTDGTPVAREKFKARLDKMFGDKIVDEPGLTSRNVLLYQVDEEINRAATDHLTEIATEARASELVNTLMSGVLDKRIAEARLKLQARLKERLSEFGGLPTQIHDEIETEIDGMNITTYPQLNERVINIFLQKIDGEFNDIVREISRKYGFSRHVLADSQTKAQLLKYLKGDLTEYAEDRVFALTFTLARSKAIEHLYRQRVDLVDAWVRRWSGVDGNPDGRKLLADELDKLQVSDNLKGISVENIGGEISREILGNPKDVAAIESEEDAKAILLNKLSNMLKPRIEQARLDSQTKLYRRAQEAKLPYDDYMNLENEIALSKITTMEQLNRVIEDAVIKEIDSEFDTLFKRVKDGYEFQEELASSAMIKAQVRQQLVKQTTSETISVDTARNQAIELLERWLNAKAEALDAIKPSRLPGTETLLRNLVLQEPYMIKDQVEELQQAINRTMDDAYRKYADSDEAKTIEPKHVFSRLEQSKHRDTLIEKLSTMVKQTTKPASMFDNEAWHIDGMTTAVQAHIADVVRPRIEASRQVGQLRKQVPDSVYQTARTTLVEQDINWGDDFIATVNGSYINTLKDDNNAGLYALLQTPEVAQREIGTKSDQTPFTFKDLVESTLTKKKDIQKPKKIHQAIDKLVPLEAKNELLQGIENDLRQVRNRVIDQHAADQLFQACVIGMLQNAEINFEAKKLNFKQRLPTRPHYETTV